MRLCSKTIYSVDSQGLSKTSLKNNKTMAKHILVTGGTGFIGQRLCRYFLKQGHLITVFTRSPEKVQELWKGDVAAVSSFEQLQLMDPFDWVINLAGEPFAEKRWTDAQKYQIQDSRILFTKTLVDALCAMQKAPKLMISGSTIGFYGDCGNQLCDETLPAGDDFTAQLSRKWEKAAQAIAFKGTRLCFIRTGLVLGKKGGALKKIAQSIKFGVGGKKSSEKQWVSWVHIDDVCRLILHITNSPSCEGIFNAASPNPVTGEQLTQAVATAVHHNTLVPLIRRPSFQFGKNKNDDHNQFLRGQKAVPKNLIDSGFTFTFPELDQCLQQIYGVKK